MTNQEKKEKKIKLSQTKKERISFSKYHASHIYELCLPNFQKHCIGCRMIKERLEKFLGEKEVGRIKYLVKKYPY